MTDAKRKSLTGLNLLSVFVLTLGSTACSLKWGDDARLAAANYESQQRNQQPQAGPVSPVTNNTTAKATTGPEVQPESVEQRVRYIRVGKERRLSMVVDEDVDDAAAQNESANTAQNSTTTNSPATPAAKTATTPAAISVDRKLSNSKSRAEFTNLKPAPAPPGPIRYPGAQMFGAGLDDSVWTTNSSKTSCEIVHPIPRYGRIVFRQRSGRDMNFNVYVNRIHVRKLKKGEQRADNPLYTDKYPYPKVGARLESVPPIWKSLATKKQLGFIPLVVSNKPFTLPHRQRIPAQLAQAEVVSVGKSQPRTLQLDKVENFLPEIWPERLLAELEEGMSLRLTYRDWADGKDDVIVTVSAINFMDVVSEFETCIKNLKHFDFTDYRQVTLNYDKNASGLDKKAIAALNKLVEYLKTSPEIKGIKIVAYTDSKGFNRVNSEVSTRFANLVKQHLVKSGVDYSITAFGAGEGTYVSDNRTAAGRAKNQRIVISLVQ